MGYVVVICIKCNKNRCVCVAGGVGVCVRGVWVGCVGVGMWGEGVDMWVVSFFVCLF